jgi:hypothetical protein
MLLLAIFVGLVGLAIVGGKGITEEWFRVEVPWGILMILSIVAAFFFGLFALIAPPGVHAQMREFEALRITVESAEARGINYMDIGVTNEVITMNRWLVNQQYYNTLWLSGLFIPDEIDSLEIIQ